MASLTLFKRAYWQKFFRVAKTSQNIATLNPRQIYIVPTRWGILYAVMLILLLVGSINYSLSLGYYITFLLASLGNMAMLHTWRNVVHLQIAVSHAQPVFAGNVAQVLTHISDTKNRARYAVAAQFKDNLVAVSDITNNAMQTILLPLNTVQRGWLELPRLIIYTEFPLSLFHAWAYVENPLQILVYPKPSDSNIVPPQLADALNSGSTQISRGDDDFDGHKSYQIGDTPSRIDWKASSKGVGLLSKQYSGNAVASVWLDWSTTNGLDFEARVSQMTKWVIDAQAAQQSYGLMLPNLTLAPNNSDAHYHQALSALALLQT
jgi:uncharacterized protein (DUF58 family)